MPRILAALSAGVLAVTLAGCLSITDPDATQPSSATTASASTDTATAASTGNPVPAPERGGRIPSAARHAQTQLAHGAASSTPQAALARYASLWCNWTAATVIARQRRLAATSLGQARAQALAAAASLQGDATLAASHVANSGSVIAITPGLGAASGDWVIVTKETTSGEGDYAGLPATVHVTYAQLTDTSGGWVVTLWSPQA